MTESNSQFRKGFDCYSAWTNCNSFQQQYKTVTNYQVTLNVTTCSPVSLTLDPTLIIKVG